MRGVNLHNTAERRTETNRHMLLEREGGREREREREEDSNYQTHASRERGRER